MCVIVYYAWNALRIRIDTGATNDVKAFDLVNLPFFFGIAVYNFDSASVVMILHKSMKRP